MAHKVKFYPVDPKKMKNAIYSLDMTLAEAGRKIGYSENIMSNVCYEKRIHEAKALLLKLKFGIDPKDYAPDVVISVPETVNEPSKKLVSEMTDQDLLTLMYVGVKRAIIEAFKKVGLK